MSMTKQEALNKIEELKKYVDEVDTKEEKKLGIAIRNRWTGEIIFQSTKTTWKEAIKEKGDASLYAADLSAADLSGANLSYASLYAADLSGANLRDANLRDANLSYASLYAADLSDADLSYASLYAANLRDADLRDADLRDAKFYGRGGTKPLKRSQLPDFLAALGFIIED